MQKSHDVLDYRCSVFPAELELLEQLGNSIRWRNLAKMDQEPVDVEPVLVAEMWLRRVLQHAQEGTLDVKGVFELSACLANEMPKIMAQREAELRSDALSESQGD